MPSKNKSNLIYSEQLQNKRDERAYKLSYKKERMRNNQSYLDDDENEAAFSRQLSLIGLKLRDIPADGNCLFRALGDQLFGHYAEHLRHRIEVVNFMKENRKDFEPFVEDDVPFDQYISQLRKLGTFAGNDAIVSFARLHSVNVVIHQLNQPCLNVSGSFSPNANELHIAYHNGDHYSSVRQIGDDTNFPANVKVKKAPVQSHKDMTFFSANSHVSYPSSCSSSQSEVSLSSYYPYNYNIDHKSNRIENTGNAPTLKIENSGIARVVRDKNSIVDEVVRITKFDDIDFITETLEDCSYNVDEACQVINTLKLNQERISIDEKFFFDNKQSSSPNNDIQNNKKLTGRQKKKLKKLKKDEEKRKCIASKKLQESECNNNNVDTNSLSKSISLLNV